MRTTLLAAGLAAIVLLFLPVRAVESPAEEAPVQAQVVTVAPTTTTTTTSKRVYASSSDLPDGPEFATGGAGTWHVVPGTSGVAGTGPLHTYVVEVEDGVTVDEQAFARFVEETLADPRGWTKAGRSVRRVDSGPASLRIRLTSQETARAICGFALPVDVSCRNGGLVNLSAARWARGAVAFDGDLTGYRRYVVNHEVGHYFGQPHRACETHGGPAPVMMQQTFSTSNDEIVSITGGEGIVTRDGKVCAPGSWPFP